MLLLNCLCKDIIIVSRKTLSFRIYTNFEEYIVVAGFCRQAELLKTIESGVEEQNLVEGSDETVLTVMELGIHLKLLHNHAHAMFG